MPEKRLRPIHAGEPGQLQGDLAALGIQQAQLDRDHERQFFEAARWAPSAYNAQPWRFLFALRGTPDFDRNSKIHRAWKIMAR